MRLHTWHLALLWPQLWLALAVRPVEQDRAADLAHEEVVLTNSEGAEGLEKSKDEEVEVPVLLPKSCNEDGILQLEPNTVYRTCRPTEPDCRKHNFGCEELRGAPGASILLATSIHAGTRFRVTGPLVFTLESGTSELSWAAISLLIGRKGKISRRAHLELYADSRGPLIFRKIRSSAGGVAAVGGKVQLLGPGKILFEELVGTGQSANAPITANIIDFDSTGQVTFSSCSCRSLGGAVRGYKVNFLNRGKYEFENCTSSHSGGAVYAKRLMHFNGTGQVTFSSCSSRLGGGAVRASRRLHFNGTGQVTFSSCNGSHGGALSSRNVTFVNSGRYEFEHCTSSTDGGAVHATAVVTIDTNAPGFLNFTNCTAKESGGAIYAKQTVLALKSTVSFKNCQALAKGNAIASPDGIVNLSSHTNITVASSDPSLGDLTHAVSDDIFAATVIVPAGGAVTQKNLMATNKVLAYKGPHTGTTCPPGSRVVLSSEHSVPVPGECVLCPGGSVSLVPARVHEQGTIEVLSKCAKVVLVRKWSANELRLTHLPRDRRGRLIVPGKMPLMWERNGSKIWATCDDYLLEVCPIQGTRNVTLEGETIRAGSKEITVYADDPNQSLNLNLRDPLRDQAYFDVDMDRGTIGPMDSEELVLGIGRDSWYELKPAPLQTCVPCSNLAINAGDKVSCEGGSHIQLRAGYMLVHKPEQRLPKFFRCPNAKACPGGHYSVQTDGRPGIQERICADGHNISSEGCTRCIATYGREDLDPFICQDCGEMQLWRRITVKVLASSILFIFAFRSAQARTDAQQIFKILLSFVTISARCASTLAFSPYHGELLRLSKLWASAHVTVDIISYLEPGGNSMALDCWLGRPLDIFENLALMLVVPGGILLVSLAIAIPREGLQAGLACWVIWCNLYMPALTGSVVKLFPCTVMTEKGARLKIFSMHTAAKCSSTFRFGMRQDDHHDEFLLPGVGMLSVMLILGPSLWIYLVQHARDLKIGNSTIINFLVTGYRAEVQWWEALVLLRKMAIFAVAVYWPLSSDSRGYSANLSMVMIAALLMNIKMKPYSNPDLNTLESMVLSMSTLCLILVGVIMQMEWPLQQETGFAIYIVNLCLFIFLNTGTFTYLVVCYYMAGERGGGNSEQGQPCPAEEPQEAAAAPARAS